MGEADQIAAMLDGAGYGKNEPDADTTDDGVTDVDADELIQDGEDEDADEDYDSEDEDQDDSDEDSDDEDDESDEDESAPTDAQAKLLDIIANLTKDKEEKEEEGESEPEDVFASQEFTKLLDVLDLDEGDAEPLKAFMTKMLDFDRKQTIQAVLDEVPKLTSQTLKSQETQQKVREQFYSSYPELKSVPGFVSQISREVAKEPAFKNDADKILKETAKRAYGALGIKPGKRRKSDSEPEGGKKKKPAFPKSTNSRKKAPKKSKMADQIESMLSSVL